MKTLLTTTGTLILLSCLTTATSAQDLPFQPSVEVYRSANGEATAFALRLEQPFLAEEFEKSNYLRLRSTDPRAYLIYPKETKFSQKHAEFYGRLRGEGSVELQLSYETVSENLDGSRRVQERTGTVQVNIPPASEEREEIGPRSIFLNWAQKQNEYFAQMLEYYPDETFFQYCLLQSKARYGVDPPPIPKQMLSATTLETELYEMFTGSLAIQESLQRQTLSGSSPAADHNTHISTLSPPQLRSLDYEQLLKKKREEDQIEPRIHEISRLVPADQYFLHFNSMKSLNEAIDLASQWGDNLLRLYTLQAQDNRLRAKLEEQLCLEHDALERLFAEKIATQAAITGSDPYQLEGTDVTVIFRVADAVLFNKEAESWAAQIRQKHPGLVEQDFNYRGHKVSVRYTSDRVVSSFVTHHEDYCVYSNSHRAIRRVVDAAVNSEDSLHDALDYRYVTTILPPTEADNSGYFFASEAFIQRLIGPAAKISQKRRVQCFNNLVMQNNASLFFRLEYGRSPTSLSEMIEKRFIDPQKTICPHGGAYAFDSQRDTCTCSLHNRLRYLTPNAELSVLQVSQAEAAEYNRYRKRYEQFWQKMYDPIAVRITMQPRVKLETCVLPFANSSVYRDLQKSVDKIPQPINTSRIAPSAVASLVVVPGRENMANYLRLIPGVPEVVQEDPTLTDLSWIGDTVSLHFCDGEIIFEIDPTQLRPLNVPMLGEASTTWQAMLSTVLMAINMPVYATIDVENQEKAERLLEQFSQRIFLKEGKLVGIPTKLDAYRLPDYKQHRIYVLKARLHAAVVRLHVALVERQLVLATKPEILREVIDASELPPDESPALAHMLLRLNQRALSRLRDDVQLYWAEKSRAACHRNIVSIYNLHRLYDAPMDDLAELSEAKYGVRYLCPDDGEYSFDGERNEVVCSVHGNREHSQQNPVLNPDSTFARFIESLDEIVVSLRFEDDALISTLEIQREEN